MKVNITGKGVIPIKELRCLAPVYNRDLTESQIRLMMKYRQFRVTKSDTLESINPYNINQIFKTEREKNVIKVSRSVEKVKKTVKETFVEPVIEIEEVSEPVTELDPIDETLTNGSSDLITEIKETQSTETIVEETTPVDTNTENVYGTSKKNKKKRNK